ncbi:hypothetical protein JR316_0010089 [Psilocybe cubensis]|uniref:Uncharacterized protein n=1 Tax=Psilocybe cubensis TaxID=181762 RepID=A0ACB8GR07_PSICU|nr:hypothetical protein JR316_0010089 [Psilocybe cubensis]KAH9477857.1 hypothetical protein JR316_0010089 [Psilocybe cubensis]
MTNTARPSPHSAIILYGQTRPRSNEKPDRVDAAVDSPGALRAETTESLPSTVFGWGNATIHTVTSLADDVLEAFAQAPYVQIIAGLVQQILKHFEVPIPFP